MKFFFVNDFTNQTETSYVNRGGVDKKKKDRKKETKTWSNTQASKNA